MPTPHYTGHLDAVRGAERIGNDAIAAPATGQIGFDGWLQSSDWPGAAPVIELRADDRVIASATADRHRPDLAQAGIGDGRHGFSFEVEASLLDGAASLTLAAADSEQALVGGRLAMQGAAPDPAQAPAG